MLCNGTAFENKKCFDINSLNFQSTIEISYNSLFKHNSCSSVSLEIYREKPGILIQYLKFINAHSTKSCRAVFGLRISSQNKMIRFILNSYKNGPKIIL